MNGVRILTAFFKTRYTESLEQEVERLRTERDGYRDALLQLHHLPAVAIPAVREAKSVVMHSRLQPSQFVREAERRSIPKDVPEKKEQVMS